jgi:hypothetical protein
MMLHLNIKKDAHTNNLVLYGLQIKQGSANIDGSHFRNIL